MYKNIAIILCTAFALVGCETQTESVSTYFVLSSDDDQGEAYNAFKTAVKDCVFFDFNSDKLSLEAKSILDRQIKWLKENSTTAIIIEGHADERGSLQYNLILSKKRARAVKMYFIKNGILKTRIQTVSFGKEHPNNVGHNPKTWAKNRAAITIVHEAS